MAGKFLSLEEAAAQLGLTEEKLKELRDRGEIHGYRDGASWKFKSEEVDRVAEELGGASGGSSALPFEDDDEIIGLADIDDLGDGESDSSILVSEVELGHSEESTSSTIIGRTIEEASADSDLSLKTSDSELMLRDEPESSDVSLDKKGSDVTLVPGSGIDSDVSLVADSSGESDLGLATENVGIDSGLALSSLESDDELTLQPMEGSSSIQVEAGSSGSGTGQSDVLGSPSDIDVLAGSDLQLESPSGGGTGDLSPGSSDELGLGSGIMALGDDDELSLSDDDDLVLGGSGTGSDVSLSAVDSGINLTAPVDSGLSLEDDEPLDLGGSSISSLELPEDDDIIALDSEEVGPDETTQLKQDEEFLLSPSDEMTGDESDSGSQVIALEDSEAFDSDAATMIGGAGGAAAGMAAAPMFQAADPGQGGYAQQGGGQVQQQIVTVPIETPEAPYSIWNVLGLLATVMVLCICGMLMMDVVRNIWSWNGTASASTGLMDALLSALKL
ncbi:MAG: helix-turn-helix domain-containing protein [Pirellulaceae bacterium]|nr:helix-turn-helix domain-containing protein [Planctomycetales bacterium]